ncbi:hypothetical protein FQA39_LY02140 [Lamprigera yunnana]|nr:hypothetical protein FQA39_LY02140 [Lamprigera yunnana]
MYNFDSPKLKKKLFCTQVHANIKFWFFSRYFLKDPKQTRQLRPNIGTRLVQHEGWASLTTTYSILLYNQKNLDYDSIGDSFVEELEKKRAEYLQTGGPKRKKKKIQTPAVKSITIKDLSEEAHQQSSTSGVTALKTKTQSQTQKGKKEIKSRKSNNEID